jgi:hypothetical protein
MRALLYAMVGWAIPLACVRSEDPSLGQVAPLGGTGGQPVEAVAGSEPGEGGHAGSEEPTGLRCDRCGSGREACSSMLAACAADADCAALLECVYGVRGCALDAGGAGCVRRCAEAACASPGVVALFLEADRCTFCTATCRDTCSSYCDAFDHDAFICPANGGAGGGGAAGDAGRGLAGGGAAGYAGSAGRGGRR